jgi:MOSC domain-containing protein YiiM
VAGEGELGPGDAIKRVRRDENGVTVVDVLRLIVEENGDSELLRRALRVPALADVWRREFLERLANLSPGE